jgi:Complex 1 protein (LYR family)
LPFSPATTRSRRTTKHHFQQQQIFNNCNGRIFSTKKSIEHRFVAALSLKMSNYVSLYRAFLRATGGIHDVRTRAALNRTIREAFEMQRHVVGEAQLTVLLRGAEEDLRVLRAISSMPVEYQHGLFGDIRDQSQYNRSTDRS